MIENISNLPQEKRILLEKLVDRLSRTTGIVAIVLGGSYASGTQNPSSDMDIGLYYDPAAPFAIADIRRIAAEAALGGKATVTGFYEWGPWVNGGAWIQTGQGKVDFLYRSVAQVEQTIAEAQQGIVHHDYDQQPAYGFYSVIYLAETQVCMPLYDPEQLIAKLKQQVAVYPPLLKQRVLADSLWSAEFTLGHARGFAAQGDIYNTVGCLTRVASNLTQALFALNERYFIRDKQVMAVVSKFPNRPSDYVPRIERILGQPGRAVQELTGSVADLEQLWYHVVSLPGVHYQPKF